MEWDEQQRAYVRALLEVEATTCSGCGGHLPETTDPDSTYTATLPYRCKRCDVIAAKQDDYKDAKHPQALRLWPVKGGPRG